MIPFLRKAVVLPIKFYKLAISPMLPPACRFVPTCSEYAELAVVRHGIWKGGVLAVCRIMRCHPWAKGGYDPVPPAKHSPRSSQAFEGYYGK